MSIRSEVIFFYEVSYKVFYFLFEQLNCHLLLDGKTVCPCVLKKGRLANHFVIGGWLMNGKRCYTLQLIP